MKSPAPAPKVRSGAKQNARPKMTVRSTLILASGMAKPTGPVHNVSDLACRSRHHSDLLAGLLTPFRRRVLLSLPGAPSVFSVVNRQYNTEKPELQGNPRPSATIFLRLSGSERPPDAHGGQLRGVQQHQRLLRQRVSQRRVLRAGRCRCVRVGDAQHHIREVDDLPVGLQLRVRCAYRTHGGDMGAVLQQTGIGRTPISSAAASP